MKKTYFLDKLYNANFYEFERIIKAIVEDLCQEEYPYTFFKKDKMWLLEIEREQDLISVIFDDYRMYTHNSVKKLNAKYSTHWQNLFQKFLRKNQKYLYNKNLKVLEDVYGSDNAFNLEENNINSLVEL